MSEANLKEENESIKRLFNGNITQINQFKEKIKNSKNGQLYFIGLLNHYSFDRPHQHNLSKELVNYVFSCFPEQINDVYDGSLIKAAAEYFPISNKESMQPYNLFFFSIQP